MIKKMDSRTSNLSNIVTKVLTGKGKGIFHKLKASFFAILIGLIIGLIPILVVGGHPFKAYQQLFIAGFNEFKIDTLFSNASIFIILAIGIGVSFKTGLFNIGAAGQFILGGAVTVIMGIKIHSMNRGLSIPLLMFSSIIVGALAASIAGIFKAFFNVHEVVSTILLNWVFYFLVKYIFQLWDLDGGAGNGSKPVPDNMRLFFSPTSYDTWIIFSVAITLGILTWILFKFTTFGYSLKVNGLNKDAAKYSGINIKLTTISSMMLSGGFCGLAGFIFYNCSMGGMPLLSNDSLPIMPFEAIAITLLAFSSPIGAIPAGIFYAMLATSSGDASLAGHVTAETINIVLAIIIMFSALAPLFEKSRIGKRIYVEILCKVNDSQRRARRQLAFELRYYKSENNNILRLLKQEAAEEFKIKKNIHNEWVSSLKKVHDEDQIKALNQIKEEAIDKLQRVKKYKNFKSEYYADIQKMRDDYKHQKNEFISQRKEAIQNWKEFKKNNFHLLYKDKHKPFKWYKKGVK